MFATGGEHGGEPLHGYVQINFDAVLDAKGAHAANSMTDEGFHLAGVEHLGFAAELGLVLGIVNLGIAGRDN